MYLRRLRRALTWAVFAGIFLPAVLLHSAEPKKALTVQDIMRFRQISEVVISDNGRWAAYTLQPDRGDGTVEVRSVGGDKVFAVERGSRAAFSRDGRWLAAVVKPTAADVEKEGQVKPKTGLAVLDLSTGQVSGFDKVEKFALSNDSAWIAYRLIKEDDKKEGKDKTKEGEEAPAKLKMKETGSPLVLRHLSSGRETQIPSVLAFAFDETGRWVVYAVGEADGKRNGLYYRDLSEGAQAEKVISAVEKGVFSQPTWERGSARLAFIGAARDERGNAGAGSLWLWDAKTGSTRQAVPSAQAPKGTVIPTHNELTWTKDGKRLFFGLLPQELFDLGREAPGEDESGKKEADFFDTDTILGKTGVDVWHWDDPIINSHQKKDWPKTKEKACLAVYHCDSGKMVPLADKDMPELEVPENSHFALGSSVVPYLKEMTWDGRYQDIYTVDLQTGVRKKILTRFQGQTSLSPDGRFILYFEDKNWHLYDTRAGKSRVLTAELKVPFFDEEDDHPSPPPSHGMGQWLEDGSAVFLYDKYDIWRIPTGRGSALNLTAGMGRRMGLTFRLVWLDPEAKSIKRGQRLLLSAYHNQDRFTAFYTADASRSDVEKKLEEKKTFHFLAAAKKADVILYSRESYDEFPNVWASGLDFAAPRKLSDANPQIKDFSWGTSELVTWQSLDGVPLQGVLIKPGNNGASKRYPVLVYFYERMSDRLLRWNEIKINHRPCFPFYAGNGYAIFLPDIVYETGRPGLSALKCLVPGVQKLIDMGVADPKSIALHGHSWGGYETAFLVTQTNMFRAAIAGAAVSNMTSAYSGIRWESGLARQFQYERNQSRIGRSLWDDRNPFIENSAVFFADRIQTPLLLMFGDEDGAVPWEQGIELYLAMRRLGKDCIFLQYRGEGHHPQKYANKLDYFIKMKQYLDHYLKGEPAPDWISRGVPYQGK
jgi:dipeptidyl aminopeptidase/acylaminoacyl peptidase